MFTWKNISSFLFDHLTQHCININGFLWLTELLNIVFFSSNMLHYKTKVWALAAIKQAHTIISAVLCGLNLFNVQSNFACSFGHPMLCRKMMVISYGSNISNMRRSVLSPDETPRRELKIRRAAEYFWRTSRCFIWWWNTVSNVWYFFSNKIIFEGEIKDANTEQFFIRFPNTH